MFIQSLLSKIIYTTRLFTIRYTIDLTTRDIIDNPLKFIEDRLTTNSNNYFKEFYILRTRFKFYNRGIISSYRPINDISPNRIGINNVEVDINILRTLFIEALESLEDLFYKEILYFSLEDDNIIDLDLKSIRDFKENTIPLEDLTNTKYLEKFKDKFIKRFRNKNSLLYKGINSNKRKTLEENLKDFFKRIERFLERLGLNFYLLSSSPLRGRAITLLKFRNTSLGTLRDIFLDKGNNLIALNTSNLDKNRDSTTLNTNTIRFLPIRLSRIVVYYITFIIPLVEYLRINYFKINTIETKLFFKVYNRELSSTTLSNTLRDITKKYFTKGITIKEYRHLITYIIKERILVDNPELLSPRSNKNTISREATKQTNIEDILVGHSTLIANTNYAREVNYFSNKTRDTTNRSLEFSKLYFNYFNLLEDKPIRLVLKDKVEYRSNIKSYKDSKVIEVEDKDISSIDSSSLDIDNNSIEENLTIGNILESNREEDSSNSSKSNKTTKSRNTSRASTPFTPTFRLRDKGKGKERERERDIEPRRDLTSNRLDLLNREVISPSKNTTIKDYLSNIELPIEDKEANRSPSLEIDFSSYLLEDNPISISSNKTSSKESSRIEETPINKATSTYTLERDLNTLDVRSSLAIPTSSRLEEDTSRSNKTSSNRSNIIDTIEDIPTINIERDSRSRDSSNRESRESNSREEDTRRSISRASKRSYSNRDIEEEDNISRDNNKKAKKGRGRPKINRTNKRGRPKKG